MNPTNENNESKKGPERRFTVESAKKFLERYNQIQDKAKALEEYYNEIKKEYPELFEGVSNAGSAKPITLNSTENSYENHKKDQEALAEQMGGIANALSPENLKKLAIEKQVAPSADNSISETVMVDSVDQEKEKQGNPRLEVIFTPGRKAASGKLDGEAVEFEDVVDTTTASPEIAPETAPAAPVTSGPVGLTISPSPATPTVATSAPISSSTFDPELVARRNRAAEIAEKMRRHPTMMTREDWLFEADAANRELIDAAIAQESRMIYNDGPTLERSRVDLTLDTRNHFASIKNGTIDQATQDFLDNRQKIYDQRHKAEYNRIYEEEGRFAAMKFAISEQAKFTKEHIKTLAGYHQERIAKVMKKVGSVTGKYAFIGGVLAFGVAEKIYGKAKSFVENTDWRKKLAELGKTSGKPRGILATASRWSGFSLDGGAALEFEEKQQEEKDKKAEEARLKAINEKEKKLPKVAVEAEPGLEFKKSNYIASVMEVGRLDGEYRTKWNHLKKAPAMYFINPTHPDAPWKPAVKAKIASGQYDPLSDYPAYGLKIYADLKKYVAQKNISEEDLKKMDIDKLLGQAISEGVIGQPEAAPV